MKQISGKDLCRVLQKHGWELARVNGSHHIFKKAGSKVRLSVPVHGNRPLRLGLLKHLMGMAGFEEKDLL